LNKNKLAKKAIFDTKKGNLAPEIAAILSF
jgi:hypothetical protein